MKTRVREKMGFQVPLFVVGMLRTQSSGAQLQGGWELLFKDSSQWKWNEAQVEINLKYN